MQKYIENGITILEAEKDMSLYNVTNNSIGIKVYLGINANESDWEEITKEEAEKIENAEPDPEITNEEFSQMLKEVL